MKKILLFFVSVLFVSGSFSQNIDAATALKIVANHASKIGLSNTDLQNVVISDAYVNKVAGTQMIYLQQRFKGIPVYNQIQTLAFKNEQLVSNAGTRISNLESRTGGASSSASITAEIAIRTALADKKISSNSALFSTKMGETQRYNFGKLDVTHENVTAELVWMPLNEGKSVKLAWQVFFAPTNSSDYWLLSVDAEKNEVIHELNLTVFCNFDHINNHSHDASCEQKSKDQVASQFFNNTVAAANTQVSPFIVNGATYRVIPYPAESPNHTGGAPELRTNPWTLAPGNATSLKWHSDGPNDFTYTRGNNVWSYHDRNNQNSADQNRSAQSTTSPDPLTFNFVPDFTVTPIQTAPIENQQFNITNLFYWNNIIHDLMYQYGLDEVSGNFQANNQGRGGVGNDAVRAEAQDGGGTNNANFATPVDGGSGRMQMYLWNGTPQKDGDVDNGIIVHEFGHGISNRLAGGPSQAGCVSNAEHMGEGWSDYYGLMATQDWANSLLTDGFTKPRGIGTYAANQPPTGLGIRSQRYCTNFAVNNRTYSANIPGAGQQHSRGEIWCATLWDMTWNIINQVGSINPDLFNSTGVGGNGIAMKLVTEGLRLQPCNSGFIDSRNAILQADQILYNGAYRCAIMTAFARRGMGFDAVQGSGNATNDQIPGFSTVESILQLTQSVTQQLEGLNITYTNVVSAGTCSGLANYLLTDTLPSNVTYVSGGTYNSANRVVSFPVNLAAGQSQSFVFTIQVNSGSWFPSVDLINEIVPIATIPAAWTTSSINNTNFTVSQAQSQSAPNAFFGINASIATDYSLATTNNVTLGATPPVLSFWHNFNTEDGWDGGLVEISTNNGTSWADLGSLMTQNGYNGSMGTGSNNPLGGRAAFTGNSNGFIKTSISLLPYANQNARFRFRVGSDDNTANVGWYIDDILLQSRPLVNMRSNLFNSSGVRVNVRDTVTTIIQNVACSPAVISTQPANTSACNGTNTSFSVTASGTSIAYQWQISTDAGVSFTNIIGATSATLNLTNVANSQNNHQYRVVVSNACPSSVTSTPATLSVTNAATVTSNPTNVAVCLNGNANFSVAATGSNLSYQWQVSNDNGSNFTNIAGATNATVSLTNVAASQNNYQYRAVVYSCGPIGTNSTPATLSITNPANITTQPANLTVCPGANVTFNVVVNGTNLSYQWQVSNNAGASFTNIPGAINSNINLSAVGTAINGYQYRVLINGTCTVDLTSAAATLNVNTPVTIQTQPVSIVGCAGNNVNISVGATGTSLTYQWQLSVNGGAFINLSNSSLYSGVTTSVLNIAGINTNMNGYNYRVIVTGAPCGAVNSTGASLIVTALPNAVLVAAEYRSINPSVPTTLFTTVSPVGTYSYQWYRNGNLVNGVSGSSYPMDVDKLGAYTVTVTDVNGCSISSNLVNVSDSVSNQLFIYPNPNNGVFQVRYYNATNGNEQRTLNVYDAKGAKVYSKQYNAAPIYDRMDVDLRNVASGVYTVDLTTSLGKRLASGSLLIQK
ncbi:MAG: M36 family metallopeptidase [Ferruginibacter sp.]